MRIDSININKSDDNNSDDDDDDDDDDDISGPSNLNTNTGICCMMIQYVPTLNSNIYTCSIVFNTLYFFITAVSMGLIQQDAVSQQTGIDSININKSDDQNIDDNDDDISGPSNLNTNTGNNNAHLSFLFMSFM